MQIKLVGAGSFMADAMVIPRTADPGRLVSWIAENWDQFGSVLEMLHHLPAALGWGRTQLARGEA